jgi:hypothetical protein
LSGFETEWATADHVGDWWESSARAELDRRANGVPDGKTQERAAIPFAQIQWVV